MQKASTDEIEIDPVLGVDGIVRRMKEWGIDDATERYVRYLWDTGALPYKITKKKRRTPTSVVDFYMKTTTKVDI
jgi:hypothetical protein